MEYKLLSLPIPPEVEADFYDFGSPPEGHGRVILLKVNGGDAIVISAGFEAVSTVYAHIAEAAEHEHDLDGGSQVFCDKCPFVEYRTDTCPQEILDMLPEWEDMLPEQAQG